MTNLPLFAGMDRNILSLVYPGLIRLDIFLSGGCMPFCQLHIYIAVGNRAGTMAGIVTHMFPRPEFHILRDPCMP